MVYVEDALERITEEMYLSVFEKISEQRRIAAVRYKKFEDRKRCVYAYKLLQEALLAEYGITEPPLFEFNEHGKPFLAAYPHIHFSLSHCDRAIVCVVGDENIGIDVEDVKTFKRDIVSYACSAAEYERVEKSLCPDLEFARLWTMKESTYKLLGTGLRDNLKSVLEASGKYAYQSVVNAAKGYVYTVCRLKK